MNVVTLLSSRCVQIRNYTRHKKKWHQEDIFGSYVLSRLIYQEKMPIFKHAEQAWKILAWIKQYQKFMFLHGILFGHDTSW